MATFHIHQDVEKENQQISKKNPEPQQKRMILGAKATQPRSFGVLSNVSNKVLPINNGKSVPFREIKKPNQPQAPAATKKPQKNATLKNVIPIEQFKTFSVYEDSMTIISNEKKLDDTVTQREPLREIAIQNDSQTDTPMSVSGVVSPMSVMSIDKSQIDLDGLLPRNDRERFFEVIEYQKNILQYFRENEKKHRPKANYMKRQPDISYSMRTILVDWLVEVAEEYRLDTETLYLAISYIDRFLSLMSVVRAKLQLVGTAAMYIASKYEEIYPPEVNEFVFITDDTYTKSQVLRMEQIILKILSFDLCVPTNHAFINTYSVLYEMSGEERFLAQYISELSLLEGDPFLQYLPSEVSAAAVALARFTLDKPMWTSELQEITSYSIDRLKDIIMKLSDLHNKAAELPQQAIQDKYKSNK
ncbi:hypothetical protein ACFFRR_009894 [Megaselia abdita]